jgi:hypothetical protein
MPPRFHFRWFLPASLLLCLTPFLSAQDGVKGALSQANLGMPLGNTLAIADLDGDNQADGAILLNSERVGANDRIRIELHFTGRPNAELTFESNGQALTVRAWDIDHDGDNDLVVEDAFTHKTVRVWINEGHGDFHEGSVQDYPSLAQLGSNQVQLPSSRPDGLPLWVPQRSYDIYVLTIHLLARPPSTSTPLPTTINSLAKLNARSSQFSRAPPLFS